MFFTLAKLLKDALLINSDQQSISTSNPINEQWEQTLALKKAQDEIVLLREQISSLQQYLADTNLKSKGGR